MKKSDELTFMIDNGALIIQAHPFRDSFYIDHVRLFSKNVHGVEIENSSRPKEENIMAKMYAEHYGLLKSAGSDNHVASQKKNLAGICSHEPINSVEDFINKFRNKETEIFTIVNK